MKKIFLLIANQKPINLYLDGQGAIVNISETRFFQQYLRQNKNTYKKMAFLARQKPGFFKKPGFLNLDAGEGIVQKTGFLDSISRL